VRAGMLAVPSRCQQRLPHLSAHDVVEIDAEGEELLEIETTKITNVMEAPAGGTLRRIVAAAGAPLPVGSLLAVVAPEEVSEGESDNFVAGFAVPEPSAQIYRQMVWSVNQPTSPRDYGHALHESSGVKAEAKVLHGGGRSSHGYASSPCSRAG